MVSKRMNAPAEYSCRFSCKDEASKLQMKYYVEDCRYCIPKQQNQTSLNSTCRYLICETCYSKWRVSTCLLHAYHYECRW